MNQPTNKHDGSQYLLAGVIILYKSFRTYVQQIMIYLSNNRNKLHPNVLNRRRDTSIKDFAKWFLLLHIVGPTQTTTIALTEWCTLLLNNTALSEAPAVHYLHIRAPR